MNLHRVRRTKIVATLGPASQTGDQILKLAKAGMNVARVNLSHGTRAQLEEQLKVLREVQSVLPHPLGVMLDTRGPEIRVGELPGGRVMLPEERTVVFVPPPHTPPQPREPDEEDPETHSRSEGPMELPISSPELAQVAQPGDVILLDDGNLTLTVEETRDGRVVCRVRQGGECRSRAKVSVPGTELPLAPVTPRDIEDIWIGLEWGIDFIAASLIRNAEDVISVRKEVEQANRSAAIIAKIESGPAVEHLEEILDVADGVMVARGDLGVDLPAEDVPIIQKRIIRLCNDLGKPVITATQMLESMVNHPHPTRAEVNDVANAILDGTDAVMLSAETALGKYPVEAVSVMARIAERTETALPYEETLARRGSLAHRTVTDAISYSACATAQHLGARAIVTPTESGHTARMVAKHRPRAPILAVSPHPEVCGQLSLVWGVEPYCIEPVENTDEMIDRAVAAGLDAEILNEGDLIVITAGIPAGSPGTTNMLKVHTVGEVLLRGAGAGRGAATGRAVLVRDPAKDGDRFEEGDVLVARETDPECLPLIERAAAIVTEAGGLTSHAAIVGGINRGLPVVVGAEGAMEKLEDGAIVTVDGQRGLVYRGRAQVR